jgi:hypothetical protein
VDGEQLLPSCELELNERIDDLDARIADQDVEAPEVFDYPCHPGLDLLLVAHVHCNPERSLHARIDFRRRFLRGLLIEICDHHLCPLAGEDECYLLADAARGARDHGDLVDKTGLVGLIGVFVHI